MKILEYWWVFGLILLTACLPEVEVPTRATCTADNWRVDPQTGEIITGNDGQAIECEFQ